MFDIGGVIMSMRRLLGSAMNLIMWVILLVNNEGTNRSPRIINMETAPCHILMVRFVD